MSTVRVVPARDETCRQVLRSTAAGKTLRLRLSNVMSATPLRLTAMTAASRTKGAATNGPVPLEVAGKSAVTIAPHAQVTTEPISLPVTVGDDIAVSFSVGGTARLSEHLLGAATGWCTGPGTGDHTRDTGPSAFHVASREGLVVEGLEVATTEATRTGIVAVGDSLTDPPLPPDTYKRWTDVLASRTGRPVANVAIGGNRVVLPGGYGTTLTERFRRDVLDRPDAATLILFAGTNDVSTGISSADLIARLQDLARQARGAGMRVVLVTLAPAWRRPAAAEQVRQEINDWIRTTPVATARVDADHLLRDPQRPTHLRPSYDRGDGLHLSALGHDLLGKAIATVVG
jgi:lysophospholipase L1-like esterase